MLIRDRVMFCVRGRDVEEKESAMTFVGGLWIVTGKAADVRRSDERGNILAALEEATDPYVAIRAFRCYRHEER